MARALGEELQKTPQVEALVAAKAAYESDPEIAKLAETPPARAKEKSRADAISFFIIVLLLLFLQANPNKERILYSGFSSFISI